LGERRKIRMKINEKTTIGEEILLFTANYVRRLRYCYKAAFYLNKKPFFKQNFIIF